MYSQYVKRVFYSAFVYALLCASTVLECNFCRMNRYVAAPWFHGLILAFNPTLCGTGGLSSKHHLVSCLYTVQHNIHYDLPLIWLSPYFLLTFSGVILRSFHCAWTKLISLIYHGTHICVCTIVHCIFFQRLERPDALAAPYLLLFYISLTCAPQQNIFYKLLWLGERREGCGGGVPIYPSQGHPQGRGSQEP